MGLWPTRQNVWRKFLNESVIPATRSKDIAALAVKDTLKQHAASVELVVQTAQWIDIDLAFHTEALQVSHEDVQAGEYRRDSLRKFSAFHDDLQLSLCLFQSIWSNELAPLR